jgi:hypothetical protein
VKGGLRAQAVCGRLVAALLSASVVGAAEPASSSSSKANDVRRGARDGDAVRAPGPFGADSRAAHIADALTAVAETSPAVLKEGADYARVLERGACSAGAQRLRIECLLVALQRYCHDRGDAEARRCALYMDVVVSNVIADRRLIPTEKRYQIVRANVDYRPALARELRRVQGTLAVDFRLRMGDTEDTRAMAKNIDRYCLEGGDGSAISYQACVSSLVWFIKGPA